MDNFAVAVVVPAVFVVFIYKNAFRLSFSAILDYVHPGHDV